MNTFITVHQGLWFMKILDENGSWKRRNRDQRVQNIKESKEEGMERIYKRSAVRKIASRKIIDLGRGPGTCCSFNVHRCETTHQGRGGEMC